MAKQITLNDEEVSVFMNAIESAITTEVNSESPNPLRLGKYMLLENKIKIAKALIDTRPPAP